MDYNAPSGSTDPNASYVGKTASTIGSKLPPKAAEHPQREIVHAIKAAGLTPSSADLTQLIQLVSRGIWLGAFGGTADALTATMPGSAAGTDPVIIPATFAGMRVRGIAGAPNATTAPKLTLTGIGAAGNSIVLPIVGPDGATALAPAAWTTGQFLTFDIDGSGNARFGGAASVGSGTGSIVNIQVFASSGTYTPTATATRAIAIAVGGGAGGSGGYAGYAGAGGGAGATAFGFLSSVSAMAVTVGLGGNGGTATSSNPTAPGTNGGTTSLGSILSAPGGQAATGWPGGAGYGAYGTVGGVGGAGSAFAVNGTAAVYVAPGGSGMSVTYNTTGNPLNICGGLGGGSWWGTGGAGSAIGTAGLPAGAPGLAPGSGGGGGSGGTANAQANGGAGANGLVLIIEFK